MADPSATGNDDSDYEARPKSLYKRGLSKAVISKIEQGIAEKGPLMLQELARVLVPYPQHPTYERLAVVAAYCQRVFGDTSYDAFDEWTDLAQLTVEDDVFEMAFNVGSDMGSVGRRQLVDAWSIEPWHAEVMGLTVLLPESVLSSRRRAEERPAAPSIEPDEAVTPESGVTRAERLKQQKKAEKAAAKAFLEATGEKWSPASGVPERTWFRQRAAMKGRGSENDFLGDTIEESILSRLEHPYSGPCPGTSGNTIPFLLNSRVARKITITAKRTKATQTPTGEASVPVISKLPTAACRRLAKESLDRGMVWAINDVTGKEPGSWFVMPSTAAQFTEEEAWDHRHRCSEAFESLEVMRRLEGIRHRKALKEGKLPPAPTPQEVEAHIADMFPPDVWQAVDPRVRPWLLYAMDGEIRPDSEDAALRGRLALRWLEPARRMAALDHMLGVQIPGIDRPTLELAVSRNWRRSTWDAFAACIMDIKRNMTDRGIVLEKPETGTSDDNEIRQAIRAAVNEHQPAIPEARKGLVEECVMYLAAHRSASLSTVRERVADVAAPDYRWTRWWSDRWFTDYVGRHPESDPLPPSKVYPARPKRSRAARPAIEGTIMFSKDPEMNRILSEHARLEAMRKAAEDAIWPPEAD